MSILRRCDWCQKPYDEKVPLTIFERERLNLALFVTGPAANVDRPICSSCYDSVTGSAPRLNNNSSLDVGQSNSGPDNLLLRNFVK